MFEIRLFGGGPDATGYCTGNADSQTEHHVGYPNGSMCRSLICNAGASSMQSMIPIVGSASWRLASADGRVGSLTRDRSLVHEDASKQHAHEGKGPGRRRTVRYGIRGLDELAGEAGGGDVRYGIRSHYRWVEGVLKDELMVGRIPLDQQRDGLADRGGSEVPACQVCGVATEVVQPASTRHAHPRHRRREGGDAVSAEQASVATVACDSGTLAARQAAAEARVEAALAAIQEAQKLIDQAAQALCRVSGMGREWRKLGALHDHVKRAWYAVTGKADSLSLKGRLLLDHEPDFHEEHLAARRPQHLDHSQQR